MAIERIHLGRRLCTGPSFTASAPYPVPLNLSDMVLECLKIIEETRNFGKAGICNPNSVIRNKNPEMVKIHSSDCYKKFGTHLLVGSLKRQSRGSGKIRTC